MDITFIVDTARSVSEQSDVVTSIVQQAAGQDIGTGLQYLGAGLAIGLAGIGVGAGQGMAAGKLAEAVSRNPEQKSKIQSSAIIGLAISESAVIYALIIAILLIFVK